MEEHMWADEPELIPQQSSAAMGYGSFDTDMDMVGASDFGDQGQQQSNPSPFQPDQKVPSVTGRIPTPIHCSFAAQLRGNSWHGEALATTPEEPNAAAFASNGLVDITGQQRVSMSGFESGSGPLHGAATTAQVMADWSMVQNRRLPSPISECGAEDAMETSRMALDLSSHSHAGSGAGPLSHLTHQHPLLAGLPPRASSAVDRAHWDRENTPSTATDPHHHHHHPHHHQQHGNPMDVESAATPSPKKGHTRSKHTLNSWTPPHPGMKRSFSIGYRADCEKCRMKVPGHFNHIIIS